MINNNISYYLTLIFRVRALRGELHSFCGTWLRCNSLEWNGALKRRPRGPREAGDRAAQGMLRSRSTHKGAPASRFGVASSCGRHCSALRGRIPRRCALPYTAKTVHFTPSNYRI
jgi:sarcosine oxidase delta subunit